MTELEKHYNKFCEDKRLLRRHGQVEYITSMKYIHDFLGNSKDKKIIDIGAGTGRYSVCLANEGYDVTAVELVKYNLGILKSKKSNVKAFQGNALDLSRFCIRYSSLILKELFIIDLSVSLHASETVNRVKRANRLVMNLFIVIFLLY